LVNEIKEKICYLIDLIKEKYKTDMLVFFSNDEYLKIFIYFVTASFFVCFLAGIV
jgi:hypothetical protein